MKDFDIFVVKFDVLSVYKLFKIDIILILLISKFDNFIIFYKNSININF